VFYSAAICFGLELNHHQATYTVIKREVKIAMDNTSSHFCFCGIPQALTIIYNKNSEICTWSIVTRWQL
jgi:hypothetical protein